MIHVQADNLVTPPALIFPRFLSSTPLSQIRPSAEQPPPNTGDSAQQGRPLVAIVVAIAFLMEQLDATIVTTAIPDMARSLQVSAVQMSLAVSAYVLTLAVFIPLSGWCADRFGGRRVFVVALGLFTTGSVLCGMADSFPMLVAMRMVQGLGGADLPLPAYATEGAAGFDLLAAVAEPHTLAPGKQALIPTGLAFAIPAGYEGQVRPRSGLAAKHGITVLNAPGTIDADYRGEVQVILINHGDLPFTVERVMRIAQFLLAPVTRADLTPVDSLDDTARGAGGFGSTGLASA